MESRLATPTAQEMDLDETDAEVQEAEAALARAKESAAKQRKTNTSVARQPERMLNWTKPLTMPAVLFLVLSLLWGEVQPSQLGRADGILSASISTATVAEHRLGANSVSKLDELLKQSGFRGGIRRHAAPFCDECVLSGSKHPLPHHVIGPRNQCAVPCRA